MRFWPGAQKLMFNYFVLLNKEQDFLSYNLKRKFLCCNDKQKHVKYNNLGFTAENIMEPGGKKHQHIS